MFFNSEKGFVMDCNLNIMKAKKEINKLIMTLELDKRSGDILSFHFEVKLQK